MHENYLICLRFSITTQLFLGSIVRKQLENVSFYGTFWFIFSSEAAEIRAHGHGLVECLAGAGRLMFVKDGVTQANFQALATF